MYHKETLVIETINFTIKSLVFQNRHLNGDHSILDTKLPSIKLEILITLQLTILRTFRAFDSYVPSRLYAIRGFTPYVPSCIPALGAFALTGTP